MPKPSGAESSHQHEKDALLQVPGRVGDACVAGGGAYAETGVGGCGSTGDGDIHLRFLPCFQASAYTRVVLCHHDSTF